MDAFGREAKGYVATSRTITSEMIRDLMAERLEFRVENIEELPQPDQWLSGSGPPYTVDETRRFGEQIGFVVCTTPSYAPESNWMRETFVKTFK